VNDRTVRHWAGGFGVAGFVVFLAALPLYFIGVGPAVPLEKTAQFSEFVARTGTFVIMRTTLADALIMVGLLVFLAGFRHLIRQARPDYEWLGSLVFGVGLVVIAVELVGDGLEAGAALDTVVRADPSVVRGLMEASFPMYGAIGLIMAALMLASAGYATLGTGVLHRWTGWFAYVAALANLLVAPSILGGANITGFYTASGYAPFVGQALMLLWFLFASVSMILKRETGVSASGERGGE
jgi:Na+/phosphate symporter